MIEINAQSSIRIQEGLIIYFDPYQIKEEKHDADIIFITHPHYDHLSIEDINKVKNENTIILTPNIDDLNIKNKTYKLQPNKEYNIKNIKIKTLRAYNINKPFHKKEYNWLGYYITINNKTYYISGDTDYLEENTNINPDYAFICIGGTYTMNYKEAAKFINKIKPKVVYPIHYKTVVGSDEDAYKFKELLDNNIKFKKLY